MDITCKYSCRGCGLHRVPCLVPARGEEDVLVWTREVMTRALMRDHAIRSPHCRTREFAEVMVPMTGTSKIGGPVEN